MIQLIRGRSIFDFQPKFSKTVLLSLVALLCAFPLVGCLHDSPQAEPLADSSKASAQATCQLRIEFGDDGAVKELELPCPEGETVFGLLLAADADERIELDATGSGPTAFIKAIDGVANQGGKGHNWVYYLNDQLGDRGAGVCPVKPGDQVRWVFGSYQPANESEKGAADPQNSPKP